MSPDPGTPTSNTRPRVLSNIGARFLPASLWDYLQEEISASELDGSQETKAERVTNFFSVPMAVEQIIIFGYFVCLDSFLYTFTILPLRFAIALNRWIASYFKPGKRRSLPVSAKCDLAKFSIFIVTCLTLHHITDASKMYHSVRGQEVIKLYVIFNVLEIADRLCCSFGQDLLDSLCSRATLGRREDGSQPRIRPAGLFMMCCVYTITHTLVLFYSLVSLNVAINSYDNALLTLLLSNQFVEIKGAVFKKFEKENLFQMSCADIVERFQLSLMLCVIAMRNLIELNGSTFSLLPTSFIPVMPSMTILQSIFSPVLIVILSEMFVDWLKHAFITKFNHIRPAVYGRFIDVLCKDLIMGNPSSPDSAFADQSPALARRLGFAALPLGCLIVRVIFQTIEMLADTSHIDECAPRSKLAVGRGFLSYFTIGPEGQARLLSWLLFLVVGAILWSCLVIIKLLIGINLRAFAVSRYANMQDRATEDQRNDRSRPHIGIGAIEMANSETKRMIEKKDYDSPGRFTGRVGNGAAGVSMETLSRFSMIKSRIY
ncbi:DUF747-domain-containing protein [Cystobasidium minutum MCA 4210]|uniref:DUF747-domain-containing protein n=1 Tax=Cystobasidium minutum MCA 4210 TaxID=1397322 RepID=UPI0034CEA6D2|eukprot:jgi/Rhomi1/142528/e_gw1.3.509.1